jgi:hypothetical protein
VKFVEFGKFVARSDLHLVRAVAVAERAGNTALIIRAESRSTRGNVPGARADARS